MSARPRVLHVITHFALGGAERVALDLARRLQARFEPAILAAHEGSSDAVGDGMRQELTDARIAFFSGTRLPLKAGGLLFASASVRRAVASFRPALVHLHTEIPEAAYAVAARLEPELREIPLVRTIHNSVYWAHWPRLGAWCDRLLATAHIAGVSADALFAFARLRAASGAHPPPAPPVLIFNGVDLPASPRPPRRETAGPVRLLFAGRFELQKGADLLPDILARVRPPSGRAAEISLFGLGSCEPALRACAARPPAGWTLRVHAPQPALARELPAFDLVLMPSRFEGLSLIALEAVLSGVPVVATDCPGLREQLPPDHPWRARPGDAADFARVLQDALDRPGQWAMAARRAEEFARARFDLAQTTEAYASLYARALPARRAETLP